MDKPQGAGQVFLIGSGLSLHTVSLTDPGELEPLVNINTGTAFGPVEGQFGVDPGSDENWEDIEEYPIVFSPNTACEVGPSDQPTTAGAG